MKTIYFISHPDVVIDPDIEVPQWPLSARGIERMHQMLAQPWVSNITAVYCSAEQKAMDGAQILADHLTLSYHTSEALGEVDRSSTGFLPGEEFERAADALFAFPDQSFRGWETATAAQARIIAAMEAVIEADTTAGNIAIISHGGVGALYLCHLQNIPITREADQSPTTKGGNYYAFDAQTKALYHGWQLIDSL